MGAARHVDREPLDLPGRSTRTATKKAESPAGDARTEHGAGGVRLPSEKQLGTDAVNRTRIALAASLNKNGAIGPYSKMTQFTDKLGGSYQAHHILEVKSFEKFKLGKPELGPSVILTDAEHKAITAELKVRTAGVETVDELWKAYQKAYADHPHWLDAIREYFVKGK